MKERPILFSGPMVRALLDGSKTQTRRVVKCDNSNRISIGKRLHAHVLDAPKVLPFCPYGQPGDRLWVRETWKPHSVFAGMKPSEIPESTVFYAADDKYSPSNTPWIPSIFMTRWASRITLEVVSVRVERLNDISEQDANAEGCQPFRAKGMGKFGARVAFQELWESINGPGSWNASPWVWVVEFKRIQP